MRQYGQRSVLDKGISKRKRLRHDRSYVVGIAGDAGEMFLVSYSTLSTTALSSKVWSQLKIIMFLSYLDSWFPRSLSTSRTVNAWFRSFRPIKEAPGTPAAVPGTSKVVPWELCAAVAAASSWSRLNSLCERRSKARYVVSSLMEHEWNALFLLKLETAWLS